MKKIEIRMGGLGGQGVVVAGQILGRAAVHDGKNAVQTQSYGAEARGSSAKSEVIISKGKIGYPNVRKCDVLVAMNQEAVQRSINDLKKTSILLIDSSTVKDAPQAAAETFTIAATETAEKVFGERLYANMIMLGALVEITRIISEKALERAIEDTVPKKAASTNIEALRKGKELAASLKYLHPLNLDKL